jgi:carboxymethylenebutenolidase
MAEHIDSRPASIETETVQLRTQDGDDTVVEVTYPALQVPQGAIVLGAEAHGPNRFSRAVSRRLAQDHGFIVAVPDFWRGRGTHDPDDYDNLDVVRRLIVTMDFRKATFDLLAAIDYVRARPDVQCGKVAVWGYCTGGTLAMFAASLDRELASAVLFYPSQITFSGGLSDERPCHPMDLLWAIRCPVVLFCGDADDLYPERVRDELRRRFASWDVNGEIVVYPGAEHVFAGVIPNRYRADYDGDSWGRAVALVDRGFASA